MAPGTAPVSTTPGMIFPLSAMKISEGSVKLGKANRTWAAWHRFARPAARSKRGDADV